MGEQTELEREGKIHENFISHIRAQLPSHGCRLNCQVHAIHERKFPPPPPASYLTCPSQRGGVYASDSKRVRYFEQSDSEQTLSKDLRGLNLKLHLNFPKLKWGENNKDFFEVATDPTLKRNLD